ncbi:transposase, partial [Streptomyces sp. NPDC002990]
GRSVSHNADLYKERNTVERLINKLKAWRGIATRYDKAPESYLAGLQLRAAGVECIMGRGTWSWIVPDGLWEIAEPLIPPSKVRPQGGGTQDTPDETLFAAIIYVLVSGCAWRALPPCFGISKSTAHRRFLIWSRAGVWGRLHEEILHRLDDAGLLDLSRAVLDSAHVRAKKGANSQVRAPWTGASRAPRCTSCRTRTDCPSSSASRPPTPTTAKP